MIMVRWRENKRWSMMRFKKWGKIDDGGWVSDTFTNSCVGKGDWDGICERDFSITLPLPLPLVGELAGINAFSICVTLGGGQDLYQSHLHLQGFSGLFFLPFFVFFFFFLYFYLLGNFYCNWQLAKKIITKIL